jgi:4-amino-4-deoxy-L-arabinose transferase-like glycosyltransferase
MSMPIAGAESRAGRRDLALFAAAIIFLVAALGRQIAIDAPLGHDEAIYAGGGREVLAGTPPSGYQLHRSVGMKVLAAAGLLLGPSERGMRSIVLLCSVGFLFAYRRLGARALGRWPAAWAAAAMVTSFGFQRRGAEILSDVPALLVLTLLLVVVVRELGRRGEGGRPGPWLLAAAPLAAAAFYLRYGLCTSLVGVAVAAAAAWWRPLAAGRWIALATVGLFALLVAPHVLYSIRETGSPIGVLQASGDAAHRAYLGQGLVQFPAALALEGGPVLVVLVVVGAVQGARCLVRLRRQRRHSRPPAEDRATAFLWVASVFHIAATGLFAHAEFRYFFFGVAGLALIGATGLCTWAAARERVRTGALAALALLAAAAVTHQVNIARYTRLRGERQVLVAAAAELRRAAGPGRCAALTGEVPSIGWYSTCTAYPLSTPEADLAAERRFLVVFARERDHGRDGVAARAALSRTHRLALVGQAADPARLYGDASVYEIR